MANTFTHTQKVATAFLLLLKNRLKMGRLVNTDLADEYKGNAVAIGDTVKMRRTPEFSVRSNATFSDEAIQVGSAQIKIDTQLGVDVKLTSKEEALDMDKLLKSKIMRAKAAALAQAIDEKLHDKILSFPQWVGTPGELVNTPADFFVGMNRAADLAIPKEGLGAVLSPSDYYAMLGYFTSYNNGGDLSKNAISNGNIPMLDGVPIAMTQNVVNLVTGSRENATIAGNSQNVTYDAVKDTYTQTLDLASAGVSKTIKRGDVFTIAGVNAVNPVSKADLGYLQRFVVLENITTESDETVTVKIGNPIISSGTYRTVSAAPVDGATVTWIGTASTAYRQNAIFHRDAIGLAFVKLPSPAGNSDVAFATDSETGISIRYWRDSNISTDEHLARCDVLFGTAMMDPRLGVRLSGTA